MTRFRHVPAGRPVNYRDGDPDVGGMGMGSQTALSWAGPLIFAPRLTRAHPKTQGNSLQCFSNLPIHVSRNPEPATRPVLPAS